MRETATYLLTANDLPFERNELRINHETTVLFLSNAARGDLRHQRHRIDSDSPRETVLPGDEAREKDNSTRPYDARCSCLDTHAHCIECGAILPPTTSAQASLCLNDDHEPLGYCDVSFIHSFIQASNCFAQSALFGYSTIASRVRGSN